MAALKRAAIQLGANSEFCLTKFRAFNAETASTSSSSLGRFSYRQISQLVKTNGKRACLVDTLALVRSLEAQGVPSKQAEAITSAMTEVLNDSLENVAHSFVSKAEMQKVEMLQESNLSKFKSEVQSSQVMIQTYCMCAVWGEPLSQTAQSFMPELLYGRNRSLDKARILLKSLVIIGGLLGLVLGCVGTYVPWLFPGIFTPDQYVINEMHRVLIPYFIALIITPPAHSLEGTLLAGRDLRFISASMSGCFSLGSLALLLVSSRGLGLAGCWYALAGFQWARFLLAFRRLTSTGSILYSEHPDHLRLEKLKAA